MYMYTLLIIDYMFDHDLSLKTEPFRSQISDSDILGLHNLTNCTYIRNFLS